MEQVQNVLKSILQVWHNLSFNQRIMLGTLTIATVLAVVFLYNHANDDYDVMMSNLDESDAAAVVHNLKKQAIPYKLAEGGTTILVPRNRKDELRLDAFKDDLIKSDKTVGFGSLSSLPFGMTDWQQHKYDQKIISDEVVTTLERIQGIKKARVILAQTDNSVFNADKVEPTASVMLIVEPGFRLKPEQVKTVKALVAHSVPELKPENVALSDSMGNSLSDDINAQGANGGSEADNARTMFEKQKSKDIMELLTPVVGSNNAVVKVSAVMNFDQSQSKIKRFLPSGGSDENPTGIPVSVQQNAEIYDGKNKDKAKDKEGAGVSSNAPTYTVDKDAKKEDNPNSNYQNTQNTTNYEVSSEEKTIVHAPGTVERMTVAVVVNKVLTDGETKELTQLISSASGIDPSRGDSVTISGLQFSPELKDEETKSIDAMKQSDLINVGLQALQIIGVLIVALAALFVFYKLMPKPAEGQLVDDDYDNEMNYASLEGGQYNGMGGDPMLAANAPPVPVLEARLDPEIEQMRASINNLVHKDPSEAARVLVSYMRDM